MQFLMPYMNMAVTTLVVLIGLVLMLLVYRALSRTVRGRRGSRLGISEYHEIDKNRRLVLIRRDDVEHLLLIGGAQDVVVESGIESGIYAAPSMPMPPAMNQPQAGTASNVQPLPLRPPPRPPVFGERRPPLRNIDPAINMPRPDNDSA
jgi:hypothetical protein